MAKYSEAWFEAKREGGSRLKPRIKATLKFRYIDDEKPLDLGSDVELYEDGVIVAGQITREVKQKPICKEDGHLADPKPRVYQVRLSDGELTTASVGAFQNITCRGESMPGF